MKKKIERIAAFLMEHAFLFITLVLSGYIVLNSQIEDYSVSTLVLWSISLLGLLALSILVERLTKLRRIENYAEQVHEYLFKQDGNPSADRVFSNRKSLTPLEHRLQSARVIFISGGSLYRLASEYIAFFEQKAIDGCKMQFLLVNPDSEAARILAQQVVYEIDNPETYINQIRISLNSLARLKARFEESIEIKMYNTVPPFSMLIVDPSKPFGYVQVEIYSFAVPIRDRLEFKLTQINEPDTYRFFIKQSEAIWKDATTYPSQSQNSSSV